MRIRGTYPSGGKQVMDDEHVEKYLSRIAHYLSLPDVEAVTLHRESGDFRYEEELEVEVREMRYSSDAIYLHAGLHEPTAGCDHDPRCLRVFVEEEGS
jgi:hypothetical protein